MCTAYNLEAFCISTSCSLPWHLCRYSCPTDMGDQVIIQHWKASWKHGCVLTWSSSAACWLQGADASTICSREGRTPAMCCNGQGLLESPLGAERLMYFLSVPPFPSLHPQWTGGWPDRVIDRGSCWYEFMPAYSDLLTRVWIACEQLLAALI